MLPNPYNRQIETSLLSMQNSYDAILVGCMGGRVGEWMGRVDGVNGNGYRVCRV